MNDTPRLTLSATLRDHDSPATLRSSVTLDPDADLGDTIMAFRLLLQTLGYHPDLIDEAVPEPPDDDTPEAPAALESR